MSGLALRAVLRQQDIAAVPCWEELTARGPASITGSRAWVSTAYEHLHADDEPHVLVAARDGRTMGVLSLAIATTASGRVARIAGYPLNDLTDALVEPSAGPAAAAALLEAVADLARRGVMIELDDLDPAGAIAAARRHAGTPLDTGDPAPTVDLGTGRLPASAGRHGEWDRMLRRLRERHAVAVRWQREEEAAGALGDLLALRSARFVASGRGHELPAIEHGPSFEPFLCAVAHRLAPTGRCAVASLVVDGRAVARDLYLLADRVAMLFLRGMHPDWMAYAPGHLLLRESARDLCDLGFRTLDLGRGDEPYKSVIGARPRSLGRLTVRRCGPST